jgi:hypothetical protein
VGGSAWVMSRAGCLGSSLPSLSCLMTCGPLCLPLPLPRYLRVMRMGWAELWGGEGEGETLQQLWGGEYLWVLGREGESE